MTTIAYVEYKRTDIVSTKDEALNQDGSASYNTICMLLPEASNPSPDWL